MAATIVDKAFPSIRPKFDLGGQVCRYSSNPQIGEQNVGGGAGLSTHSSEAGLEMMSHPRMSGSTSAGRSLNPELLMREFTQDEQGRIDSLGATDSPSACFQSQFAREVVQNTRRSSSAALDSVMSNENSLMAVMMSKQSKRNSSSKYRSQFAAKHHQVKIYAL